MGIILGETSNAEKSVEGTRTLVPVYSSELTPSDGEISIRSQLIGIHQTMEGAVHRFDLVHFIFDIHLIKHIRAVEIKMARRFPQVQVGNVWGVNDIISILLVGGLPEIFDDLANLGSLRMPEDKATTGVFLNGKEIQLFAEHTVISLLCLLQHFLVLFKLSWVFPSCGVNALQHFTIFISSPVGSCNTLQRQGFLRNFLRRFNVRSCAQIPPFISNVI
mmetsp:Transcript_11062/g.32042  ORF Transcript_11062/g.32042 Transcript_11062/m.32042 type:complete len:219 (+) Transcript_11062:809-1465(+)